MGAISQIQWTDATWNIARGCHKLDEDCKFCYMYRDSFNGSRYNPLKVVRTKTVFDLPLRIKEPSKIFVSSLTDWALPEIDPYRDLMWAIIRRCPQHTFQMLTKRPERLTECLPSDWGKGYDNVWLGTSVGGNKGIDRLYALSEVTSKVMFWSLEPLHERLYIPNDGLMQFVDWVIIGGESGNDTGKYRYRPCKVEWIEDIVERCKDAGVPIFVKQLGTHLSKELKMSDRHGGNIEEFPEHLRIRQFPT